MEDIDLDKEFGPEVPDKVEVVNFPEGEKLGDLITDLKKAIEGIETQVSVNVGTKELAAVVESLEGWQITTVEAINAIPQPTEPKDYSKYLEDIKKALKKDIDFTPIVLALERIQNRETKVEVPGFSELKDAISAVGEKIDNIKGFEIPEKLIYKDQLKVSVDRIGGGGGAIDTSSLATAAKQDDIIAALGGGVKIKKIDEALPYTYIGEAAVGTATGAASWSIKRIDETSDPDIEILYAGTGVYDQIWDNRVGLTYN